ncbi:tetratricopeptide repeat protein [Burkholderiaceae bacterium DAT-1]|nr:tetratricopeptide repeat protein [Burkholderiaceae bacterium DAT-1]
MHIPEFSALSPDVQHSLAVLSYCTPDFDEAMFDVLAGFGLTPLAALHAQGVIATKHGRFAIAAPLQIPAALARIQSPLGSDVAALHATHITTVCEQAACNWHSPDEPQWTHHLDTEQDNIHLALGWACDTTHTQIALRLVATLAPYWISRGKLPEGRNWVQRTLQLPRAEQSSYYAAAQVAMGKLLFWLGDLDRSIDHFERALSDVRAPNKAFIVTTCHAWMAGAHYRFGRQAIAEQYAERALTAARRQAQYGEEALAQLVLGGVYLEKERFTEAESVLLQCQSTFQRQGDYRRRVLALNFLSLLNHYVQRPAVGHTWSCEAIALCQAAGDLANLAYSLTNLGIVLADMGDLHHAHQKLSEATQMLARIGATDWASRAHAMLFSVCMRRQDDLGAQQALHAAIELAIQANSARRQLLALSCICVWRCHQNNLPQATACARMILQHEQSGTEARQMIQACLPCLAEGLSTETGNPYAGYTLPALLNLLVSSCQSVEDKVPVGD